MILLTTSSLQDSGLLEVLIPVFEKKTGYVVKTLAVGSGQALTMGERGEADVLFVHSPEAEVDFVNRGFGVNRKPVMYNDFVIVGPPEDSARVKGLRSALEAIKRIAAAEAIFVSRGDNSGTHIKERAFWRRAKINVEKQKWYQETGLGMGQTLVLASEKRAYTITDRGTFLALRKRLNLSILVEGDWELKNVYHVIEVNPQKWPRVNAEGARSLARFLTSPEARKIIETFGREKYGRPLFHPWN